MKEGFVRAADAMKSLMEEVATNKATIPSPPHESGGESKKEAKTTEPTQVAPKKTADAPKLSKSDFLNRKHFLDSNGRVPKAARGTVPLEKKQKAVEWTQVD